MAGKLDDDIRSGKFSRVYLFYGEEEYLLEFNKRRLMRAIIPQEDEINLNIWNDKDPDVNQIIEQAQTLPFFAEHRVIVLEDTGLFKTGDAGERLAKALPTFPDETVLIFTEKEKPDARGKLFKTVRDQGYVQEFVHLKDAELERYILRRLDKNGKKIQRSALALFMERVGDDMRNIVNEMEKLVCYTAGREAIYLEDVQQITTLRLENRIFAMTDAIAQKNVQKALVIYEELLSLKEKPLGILALLYRQYERILQVKELRDRGMDQNTIIDKLQMKSFLVRNSIRQGENYTYEEVREILDLMGQTDADIKSGRMKDTLAVELVVVKAAGN